MFSERIRSIALNSAVVVLTIAALAMVTVRVKAMTETPRNAATDPVRVDNWKEYATDGPRLGALNAPVVITVFSDFQCPFCRVAARRIGGLRRKYGDNLAMVYRYFPLEGHLHARTAAFAAMCADEQGKFSAMHDALFARQDSIGRKNWVGYAKTAGVKNERRFLACLADSTSKPALKRDSIAGARLGVRGTPTMLINDWEFVGTPPLDVMEKYIQKAITTH